MVNDSLARAGLTLLILAVFGLCVLGMWRSWRRKAGRHLDLLPLPEAPSERGELRVPSTGGLYVGTTVSGDWQARVVTGHLSDRSAGTLNLSSDGLSIERDGAPEVFIPAEALRDVRLDSALAGKVMGAGRLLVVTWEHRGHLLDTGFRADQHILHASYLHALRALLQNDEHSTAAEA